MARLGEQFNNVQGDDLFLPSDGTNQFGDLIPVEPTGFWRTGSGQIGRVESIEIKGDLNMFAEPANYFLLPFLSGPRKEVLGP